MAILDGKQAAQNLGEQTRQLAKKFLSHTGRAPTLHIIQAGDHPPSDIYVQHKLRQCQSLGLQTQLHRYDSDVTEDELLTKVDDINHDNSADGLLVQLPLPTTINSQTVLARVSSAKDIDGLTAARMGYLCKESASFFACTPQGIIALLKAYKLPIYGKHAVVVGASMIVGRPMALALLNESATITVCHSATRDLKQHVAQGDILVVATGKRNLIPSSWIKPGAVVIDVGIHRLEDGRIVGDLDHSTLPEVASWYTPVPGGVGPMTVAMVAENTVRAAYERAGFPLDNNNTSNTDSP